jgi:hypothetical protein
MTQTDTFVGLFGRAITLGLDAARTARAAVPELPQVSLPMPSVAGPCEVPPPCWWPKDAGEVTSVICDGATATLRVRVTNCGPTARQVTVEAPKDVTAEPASLDLGPMERGTVLLKRGGAGEAVVWVRGCHEHFVRWTVKTSGLGSSSCHEVAIDDCPDYRHHWYDHFYCERPCPADARR